MLLDNQVVVVTGGTGSLGKTLVRRMLTGQLGFPHKIIIFSRDEAKQLAMRMQYYSSEETLEALRTGRTSLEFRIGDVRDYRDVCGMMQQATIVVHAAALKQVPSCEYNPMQAVMTNVIGASNIVQAVAEQARQVHTVIGISTDKACRPANTMGMTKALQERIFAAANLTVPQVRFMCVRYGNVLASRGSVIPLFIEQIRKGGPVTVTHPDMTRFLISLEQAVDAVFAACQKGRAGEIYVPNAPSATVANIARALVGERPIAIEVIGIRPGEKMHEILISSEEAGYTTIRDGYFAISSMLPELALIGEETEALDQELSSCDHILDLEATQALLDNHGVGGEAHLSPWYEGEILR